MQAGFAENEIELKDSSLLVVAGSGRQCRFFHDPLYLRVAVLASEAGRVVIVSLDLVGLVAADVAKIREVISSRFGIGPQWIMVCATHCHNSFSTLPETLGESDPWNEWLRDSLCLLVGDTVGEAMERMEDAVLEVSSGSVSGVAGNRRPLRRDGTCQTWSYGPEADIADWGPVDERLQVLSLKMASGRIASIYNFGCHPNSCWTADAISADYPGVVSRVVKAEVGDDTVSLFLNGPCGNIDPFRFFRLSEDYWKSPRAFDDDIDNSKMFAETERIGSQIGTSLVDCLKKQGEIVNTSVVTAASARVRLPLYDFKVVSGQIEEGTEKGQGSTPRECYDYQEIAARLDRQKQYLSEVGAQIEAEVEIQLFCFGRELALIGVPADFFVEYGLEIRKQSPFRHTLVVAFANGMCGYIPTEEAFRQGGYEPYCLFSKYPPGAGARISQTCLSMLQNSFQKLV